MSHFFIAISALMLGLGLGIKVAQVKNDRKLLEDEAILGDYTGKMCPLPNKGDDK